MERTLDNIPAHFLAEADQLEARQRENAQKVREIVVTAAANIALDDNDEIPWPS